MKWIFCIFPLFSITSALADPTPPLLTVTGEGKTTVKAALADIRIGVEVEGKTALEVQKVLTERLNPVLDVLKKMKQDKIETSSMNIIPEYSKGDPPQIVGYRGVVEVSMTKEAAQAGNLIDEAFKAGANKLLSISLKPSEEELHDARMISLQKACENALEEAEVVSKALQIKTKGIKEVAIESGTLPAPIPLGFSRNFSLKAGIANSTEIMPQEQTIPALVNIKVEIQP